MRSLEALDHELGRLRLPSATVSSEDIHIITQDELSERIGGEAQGAFRLGHIYVSRLQNAVDFSRHLTHELSHAASFGQIKVHQPANNPRQLRMWNHRMGFAFQPFAASDPKYTVLFNGLNEGCTELMAGLLRRRLVEQHASTQAKTKVPPATSKLLQVVEYNDWVDTVDSLIRFISETDVTPYEATRDQLIRDYMTGSFHFLRRLERRKKGASRILARAPSTPQGAREAREFLQL